MIQKLVQTKRPQTNRSPNFHKYSFVRTLLDDILDERDQSDFEQPWLDCAERIKGAWDSNAVDEATTKCMDEIRKESFLAVSRATQQHEIASYVSDDFELISKSIALDLDDTYATDLLESYRSGKIPQ